MDIIFCPFQQESTAKATDYCERVEVTASVAQLEREIKKIQERLREQEAQRGATLEEIALDMQHRQDLYKSSKLAIHQMEVFNRVRPRQQLEAAFRNDGRVDTHTLVSLFSLSLSLSFSST